MIDYCYILAQIYVLNSEYTIWNDILRQLTIEKKKNIHKIDKKKQVNNFQDF